MGNHGIRVAQRVREARWRAFHEVVSDVPGCAVRKPYIAGSAYVSTQWDKEGETGHGHAAMGTPEAGAEDPMDDRAARMRDRDPRMTG